jgi:hypothetical protein
MTVARFVSGFNAFIPEAENQLIGFMRSHTSYKYNQYVQLVPAKKRIGVYPKMHVDDPARLVNPNAFTWEDGADRPDAGLGNGLRFDWAEFQTHRRNFPFRIGWLALEQSSLPLLSAHAAMVKNQALMDRTQKVIDLAETVGTWGDNTATANVLNDGAGHLDEGSSDPASPNYLAIKKCFNEVCRRVHVSSNGAMAQWKDGEGDSAFDGLMAIMSPDAAIALSNTSELHDYLARSPFALAQVEGRKPGQNTMWGLPDILYGVKIIVEDALRVYEHPKASGAAATTVGGASAPRRYIKNSDSIIFCARPGGIQGVEGAPSWSTFQLYHYGKELQLETEDDNRNRRTNGDVVIDDKVVVPASQSGFLVTDVLA